MALAPLKSPENPLHRSRSSSCSSPLKNQITYHEVLSVGPNTLYRSFSCSRVFDKREDGTTFQATQIQFASFLTPQKKTCLVDDRKINTEPKKREVSFNRSVTIMSKKKLKVEPPKKKTLSITVISFILAAVAVFMYYESCKCTQVWDLQLTKNELLENIFGQSEAITKINFILETFNTIEDVTVMVWTGGVGVGKTYSSSFIIVNFPWKSNVFLYYSEFFENDVENIMKNDLLKCSRNLFVFEDLSLKHSIDVIKFIKKLNNQRKSKEKILIILIFLIQSKENEIALIENFKKSSVEFYHVPFKNLDKDAIRKCFYKEMERQNVRIYEEDLDKLVEEKIKHIAIVKGVTGCKGVADEVAFLYNKVK